MATGTLTSTNPAATYKSLLKVQGTNQVLDSTLRVIEDGDGNDSSLKLTLTGSTYGASFAGKVGIGVDDPDQPLEIACNDTTDITAANISNNSASGLHISNTNTAANDGAFIKFSTGTTESAIAHIEQSSGYPDLVFYTDNSGGTLTEAMRIDDSQNVGIGTTTPTSLLFVNGDITCSNTNGSLIEMQREDSDNTIGLADILGSIDFTGDAPVNGTFEPGARISALANGGWEADNHPSRLDFFVNTGSSSAAITSFLKMRIDNLGNVLIGATAVAGSGNTALCILNGNDPADATANTACFFASSGEMNYTDASGNAASLDSLASDERMKDNIVAIPNALSRLQELKGITFNYVSYKYSTLPFKDKIADDVKFNSHNLYGNNKRVGVIAQDVEKAYDGLDVTNAVMELAVEASPEADTQEIYGKVKKVRVETLIPLLIEAVKELSAEVEKLKA